MSWNKRKSRSVEIMLAHVSHQGEECLIWPMGRNNYGYGQLKYDGKIRKAHRVMCQLAHGEPPSPKHQAAHSCGNGHLGCFNPQHLSWKTPSENMQDTVTHGAVKPAGIPRRKLTAEQVAAIRHERETTTLKDLSHKYGVRTETIRKIVTGETWAGPARNPNRNFSADVRSRLIQQAGRMRKNGATLDQIGAALDISRKSVQKYLQKIGQS